MTDNTTPAQAAGLKRRIFCGQTYFFGADVDALLQRASKSLWEDLQALLRKDDEIKARDRQIAELVAALKSERKSSAQWAEMAGTFRGQYHDSCNQITELVAALLKLTRIAEIESIDVDEYDALLAQHAAPEVA